ncbi:MAG TPA: 2-phosphosulfolactate phosphatase [Candidatus Bathyarchaeia archaeon]|nr:2-phosphosulfolactate phosphatase [Candidatus Bathyarchaeia archaeon]
MSIEVVLLGNNEGSKLASETTNGVAIIVDVLRASTTIPTAMRQGLNTFYVAKEVEDTRQVKVEFDTLLMGERGCLMLEGFDFGNSPVEVSSKINFAKPATAFTSSTGARRVVESIGAKYILIGSIVNAKVIAQKVIDIAQEDERQLKVVIIPAFSEGNIQNNTITEDQLGGLIIANEFQNIGVTLAQEVTEEIAYLEELLKTTTLYDLLYQTAHGKKLIDLNYIDDIEFCSRLNFINIVPISRNDIITLTNNTRVVKFSKE